MKSTYTLKLSFLGILFTLSSLSIATAQVGIGTTTPDDSAALDIDLTDAGFLMPRVTLTGTDDITTISGTEATGLLVYNTANVSCYLMLSESLQLTSVRKSPKFVP